MSQPGEPCEETVSLGGGSSGGHILPATAASLLGEQTIREFIPASWFHPVGIFKVLARFWDRLPDVSGKLFLTFTLDPKNYANEETAFEDSRDWLRKVFYQFRHPPSGVGRCQSAFRAGTFGDNIISAGLRCSAAQISGRRSNAALPWLDKHGRTGDQPYIVRRITKNVK